MNENGVYEKIKKIEFLKTLISEKEAAIAELQAENAAWRKKNGRILKSDVDLRIFDRNKKIASEKEFIAESKKTVKTLKEEAAEELTLVYPTEKEAATSALKSIYGDRMFFTDENEEKRDVVSDTHSGDGFSVRLVRAGLKTSGGKIIRVPQIEIYSSEGSAEPSEEVASAEETSFVGQASAVGEAAALAAATEITEVPREYSKEYAEGWSEEVYEEQEDEAEEANEAETSGASIPVKNFQAIAAATGLILAAILKTVYFFGETDGRLKAVAGILTGLISLIYFGFAIKSALKDDKDGLPIFMSAAVFHGGLAVAISVSPLITVVLGVLSLIYFLAAAFEVRRK
ncbi:MAG: hypothetical protein J5903_03370 [Clostridia bacterium]|nr:hypothetical protein [Clostridia bacterium]